jgi:Holliday junction resolvase
MVEFPHVVTLVALVFDFVFYVTIIHQHVTETSLPYTKASPKLRHIHVQYFFIANPTNKPPKTGGNQAMKEIDKIALRRWRKRGFYSESVLVKLLQKNGYHAVRIPVSNPSLSPLPDIMARKNEHSFAFEVKNATYYAYFPKTQIDKLFRFLNELIPTDQQFKHAVIAAHLGKKWTFKEIPWADWEKDKLPEKVRILKRDRGNIHLEKSF